VASASTYFNRKLKFEHKQVIALSMKFNLSLLLIGFLMLSNTGFSQSIPLRPNQIDENGLNLGDWVYLYDEDWDLTEDGTTAEYYQLVTYKNGKPLGMVVEYFRNGQILVEFDSIVSEDPLLYEGMQKVYSEEGNLVSIGYISNGKLDTTFVIQMFMQLIDTYTQEKPDHLDLANTANNLAYLYVAQEQYDSAEIYYRIAQEIREQELDMDDVLYANSCNKLAHVLVQQGRLLEAEPLYETSMRVHGQTLGKESDYYKNSRSNLAYIYMKTARYEQAKTLYQEAVARQLKDKEGKDESYRYYCYKLARVYAKLNDWENALDAYLESKNINDISKANMLWFVELMEE
jgi:tetratricopeptide (TPR) repeat protein